MAVAAFEETAGEKALTAAIKGEQEYVAPKEEGPKEDNVSRETIVTPEKPAAEKATEPAKPQRLVPHQALHEERTKRQALERQLKEIEARTTQAPPPEIPDETKDPIGTITALRQEIERAKQERAASYQMQQLASQVQSRIASYAQEHPEYIEQMQFLRKSRADDLRDLGHTDGEIGQIIAAEEMSLAKMAVDKDLDPGEMIAKFAVRRGWQAKAPPVLDLLIPPVVVPPAAAAAAQIDRLERGQRAATTSSRSGGESPRGEMTIEDIVKLNGKAFDDASARFINSQKGTPNWR